MNIREVYLRLRDGLNKLSTNNEQDIPEYAAVYALNKAQLEFLDNNYYKFEKNQMITEAIRQFLVSTGPLSPTSVTNDYNELKLPDNYVYYVNSSSKVGECDVNMHHNLREEYNINDLLRDSMNMPSLEWEETICTLFGDSLRVYTSGKFNISSITLNYIREPRMCNIDDGYTDLDGNRTADVDLEWTGSSLEDIIDIAVSILAGNINDMSRFNTINNRLQVKKASQRI
jgi:hypothetical protein